MADVSPYPAGHFHRRLASFSAADLKSELLLRAAFGLKHARTLNQTPGSFGKTELMSLLDDLLALGGKLPPEVKPVADDLVNVVSGLVKALEDSGLISNAPLQTVPTTEGSTIGTPAPAAGPSEPPTVGSVVADVYPGGPTAPDNLQTYTVQELADELGRRQAGAILEADAKKSRLSELEPVEILPDGPLVPAETS